MSLIVYSVEQHTCIGKLKVRAMECPHACESERGREREGGRDGERGREGERVRERERGREGGRDGVEEEEGPPSVRDDATKSHNGRVAHDPIGHKHITSTGKRCQGFLQLLAWQHIILVIVSEEIDSVFLGKFHQVLRKREGGKEGEMEGGREGVNEGGREGGRERGAVDSVLGLQDCMAGPTSGIVQQCARFTWFSVGFT